MQLIVGVDIDNTLNDISQSIARYLDVATGQDTEDLLNKYLWIEQAVGWSNERVKEFFQMHGKAIHWLADIKDPYVELSLKGLFLRAIPLHILTNRSKDMPFDVEKQTHDWLEKHHLVDYFKSVHFIQGDKQAYCMANELKVNVVIEDNVDRAREFLDAGVFVILLDYPYNQDLVHNNLIRVRNWWEVFQEVVKLQARETNIL